MEFTREAWENAPEGARLEWQPTNGGITPVHCIGFLLNGTPVVEDRGYIRVTESAALRIILPKRKVTVQLWRCNATRELALRHEKHPWPVSEESYTLLGEHTFEIEGEC